MWCNECQVEQIWIDPRFQFSYSSYYIEGLFMALGKDRVGWKCLPDLTKLLRSRDDYRKGMAFIAIFDGVEKRIFIDTFDSDRINEGLYAWTDVYAKVNARQEDLERNKLLPIGPMFSVQVWNPLKTVWKSLLHYAKSLRFPAPYRPSLKAFLLDYAYTFVRRMPYHSYINNEVAEKDNYVFALNTLWYDPLTYNTTNRLRGVFMRTCQRYFERFEGGFFFIGKGVVKQFPAYSEYQSEYGDLLFSQRMSPNDYLKKTKESFIVFNTPSVLGCHSWKLAEYLAMGKAIISMPLNNIMPGDFEDVCLFATNEEKIEVNVLQLKSREDLRQRLKKEARNYFEQYLAPDTVIGRILEKACS